MRPFILLQLAAILIFCSATAQQYHPFPYGNAFWSDYNHIYVSQVGYFTEEAMYFASGKDTTIKGNTYQKIMARSLSLQNKTGYLPVSGGVSKGEDYYICAIREDNKKLYMYYRDTETLMWDFNVNIGDTIKQIFVFNTYDIKNINAVITSADSVSIGGVYRKRYITTNSAFTLVEGIGANGFPFFYGSYFSHQGGEPICYTENGYTTSYSSTYPCYYIHPYGTPTGISNTAANKPASIYPNPFSNQLIVDANAAQIKLTDAMGKVAITQLGSNKTINTENLPTGLYILTLHDDSGNVTERRKLIKE
ncbi:MAG: T9SS type A sorting domain-containing protein [Chitinophagales bacterium]|nr:T9SS type A sorting domain-containing protein [Chitinophagales bacterium]